MTTTLIRSLHHIPSNAKGGVVTIGNFDGVHLGHQRLIGHVIEQAKARGVPSVVVTFEPHPFEYFNQENLTIPRITRLREKFMAMSRCGVDYVLIIPFNHDVAGISASDFVRKVLFGQLQPVHIMIGDDFRFGHKRQGDFELLSKMGRELGFSVDAMPSVLVDGVRVSSTLVRAALMAGDLALAAKLLGRPYWMSGRIRPGDQLGRQLGFPTANIHLHRRLTPVKGVYSVLMHGLSAKPLPGAANVGTRPTVDGTRTLLEIHLLDFDQDIYGRYIEVEFCEKLRDEVYYPNLDLLKEQIAKDVEATKHYFRNRSV